MQRMGVLRRGGMWVACGVMGLALVLGGCAKDKKTAEMTTQENTELREKIAQLEEACRQKDAQLAALNGQHDAGNPDDAPFTRPASRGNGGGDVFTKRADGVPEATIAGDVLFASGSADIKAEGRKSLDRVASEIKQRYNSSSIRVEGYTDSDPLTKTKAKWGSNQNLSQARAESVKKYLSTKGIKSGRVEAMGFGSAKPKSTKAQSRRVEILIVN